MIKAKPKDGQISPQEILISHFFRRRFGKRGNL
jgi:hypothetical protein